MIRSYLTHRWSYKIDTLNVNVCYHYRTNSDSAIHTSSVGQPNMPGKSIRVTLLTWSDHIN